MNKYHVKVQVTTVEIWEVEAGTAADAEDDWGTGTLYHRDGEVLESEVLSVEEVGVDSDDDTEDPFKGFCRNATDNQLENILLKEWDAKRKEDYNHAKTEAERRGWTVSKGRRL